MKIINLKSINKVLFVGFFLAVIFSFLGFDAQTDVLSNKLVRLHVLANSDTDLDQNIKITVKDEVNEYTESLMNEAKDIENAKEILFKELINIEAIANQTLNNLDVEYDACVNLSREYFNTRIYDNFTLPAGYYNSLIVSLGKAEGQNWWCVVYPLLCTGTAVEENDNLTENDVELIENTPKITFWIYEAYMDLKNFLDNKI